MTSITLLAGLVLLLGIRHGVDLDHLAAIDSITRNLTTHQRRSNYVGLLFALGHGGVAITISVLISAQVLHHHPSPTLSWVGNAVSIFFLLFFGLLTLYQTLQSNNKPNPSAVPLGWKSWITQKWIKQPVNPITITLIGALFALSFDTFSQIGLFTLVSTSMSGYLFSALLGFLFMLGMMLTDGCQGWIVAHVLQGANRRSVSMTRFLGISIGLFSVLIGVWELIEIITF